MCLFENCDLPLKAKGYCSGHYQQQRVGNPLRPIVSGKRNRDRRTTESEAECSRCNRMLPLDSFNAGSGRGGLATWCRRCFVLWKYDMTQDEFERLSATQGGACRVCGVTDKVLHIDHDHGCCPVRGKRTCGQCTRGLLCGECNRAIGLMSDSAGQLRAAADYLDSFS